MDIPKHIALILDGNRRYAVRKGLDKIKGHGFGAKAVEKLFEWALELKINEITLYALSTENLNRNQIELNELFRLLDVELKKLKEDKRLMEKGVRIRIIGNLSLLPENLNDSCVELEEITQENNNLIVNIALAYGGKAEVLRAVKKIVEMEEAITDENIKKNLQLQSDPELIIRTGGMIRTSNFLLWQSTYSEWIFLKKLWPEFTKKDLEKCIKEFQERKRNFGR